MSREMQLRDIEILVVLDAMMAGAEDKDEMDSAMQETAKRCDCTPSRINEAAARVGHDNEHLYWKEL